MAHPPTVALLPVLDGVVVTAAGIEAFDCPVCGCARDLVVPRCDDDPAHAHDDCPDRACAVCGFALAVGVGQAVRSARAADTLDPRRTG